MTAVVPPKPVVLLLSRLLKDLMVEPAAAFMAVPLLERTLSRMVIVPLAEVVATPLVEFAARRQSMIVANPFALTSTPVVLPSMFEFRIFATAKPAVVVTLIPVTFLWIIVSLTYRLQLAAVATLIPMPVVVPLPVVPSITESSTQTLFAARMLMPLTPVEAPLMSRARRRTAFRISFTSVILMFTPVVSELRIDPYPAPCVPLM